MTRQGRVITSNQLYLPPEEKAERPAYLHPYSDSTRNILITNFYNEVSYQLYSMYGIEPTFLEMTSQLCLCVFTRLEAKNRLAMQFPEALEV
jgi:hypothetical protein